jgi:hypothetical protein
MSPGDALTYHGPDGKQPATYDSRHGLKHCIELPAHGARGKELRYVWQSEFTPVPADNGEAK